MKDHLKIINSLPLWNNPIKIEELHGGITNFNYLVHDKNNKFVTRFASPSNNLLGLNREREINNMKIATSLGIGPKFIEFFPQYNLLIVEYIEGKVLTPATARNPEQIKQIATILKKLHNGPKFEGTFNPFRTIKEYI